MAQSGPYGIILILTLIGFSENSFSLNPIDPDQGFVRVRTHGIFLSRYREWMILYGHSIAFARLATIPNNRLNRIWYYQTLETASKNGVLKQDILDVTSQRTSYTTGTTEWLPDNQVSLTIQHSESGSFSELILQ